MSAATENNYQLLVKQAEALVDGESDWTANTANVSVLLFNAFSDVSFAGVYRYESHKLILGLLQGKPTCVHIAIGKGVYGATAGEGQTQIIRNIREFAGHIACDSDPNSEIVIPIFKKNGELWGVFDFDSTKIANFDELDQKYLEAISNISKF